MVLVVRLKIETLTKRHDCKPAGMENSRRGLEFLVNSLEIGRAQRIGVFYEKRKCTTSECKEENGPRTASEVKTRKLLNFRVEIEGFDGETPRHSCNAQRRFLCSEG